MPLARYFFFVGGVLLALLLVLDACLPKLQASAKAKVYPPVIRIYSDRKWPERIVYDTSLPTIVSASDANAEPVVRAPDVVAETLIGIREQVSFAMLRPSDEQSQPSRLKMAKLKPRPQVRVARKRVLAPNFAMARHLPFGWFGGSFW